MISDILKTEIKKKVRKLQFEDFSIIQFQEVIFLNHYHQDIVPVEFLKKKKKKVINNKKCNLTKIRKNLIQYT